MADVYFPSRVTEEVVQVEFLATDDRLAQLTLLVDSGFTGESSIVLSSDVASQFSQMEVEGSRAVGALQGVQERAWVICRIPVLSFESALIAIFADLSSLALPPGIDGMVGLSFLRQFDRWGAEKRGDGSWRFGLTVGNP